jgi:N-formylglutamate amidohydrolase
MAYNRIVLAIPHSTRTFRSCDWSDRELVERDADRWTDWRTEELFDCQGLNIFSVVGRISRFDCDLERLEDDPLEERGQGRLYTQSHSGATRVLTDAQAADLIVEWHQYRRNLADLLVDNTLLIDCHSFPCDISPIDICLGFNQDWSSPSEDLIQKIKDYFGGSGYCVGINDPYSNSITPSAGVSYHSLMIEVNKKCYLDDAYQLSDSGVSLRRLLHELYAKLLGESAWD